MNKKLFSLFIVSRSSINIADSIYVIVIMWAIQTLTNNTSYTSFTYAASTFAGIFIVFIGPHIDKKSPLKIIFYVLIIQVLNLFCLIYLLSSPLTFTTLIIIMIVIFISSFCSSIFYPANNTFFTSLFSKEFYKKGNSIFQTLDQVINFACFLLIGILIKYIGSISTLYLSIALFTFGFFLTLILNFSLKKDKFLTEKDDVFKESYTDSLINGFKIIKNITILKLTLPLSLYANLAIGGFISLLPAIAEQRGPIYYSSIYIIFFSGFIIGAILSNKLKTNIKTIYILSLLCGVFLFLFSTTLSSYFSMIFILFFGSCSALINIFDETIYQENTPSDYMGTVLTMKRAILSLSAPIGAVIVGILAYYFNTVLILIIIASSKIIFDSLLWIINKKNIVRG